MERRQLLAKTFFSPAATLLNHQWGQTKTGGLSRCCSVLPGRVYPRLFPGKQNFTRSSVCFKEGGASVTAWFADMTCCSSTPVRFICSVFCLQL